jgi:hypothetical protein
VRLFKPELKILLQTSMSMTPLHLLGSARSPFFWNGDPLALVPSIEVSGAIKELANIMVDPQSHSPPKGLVCFWWDVIEPWSLA